jgi:predicted transcriptional regulator
MTTIEVSENTRAKLRELALATGDSEDEVAEKAIELYRRRYLLDATNAAYAALRNDSEARRELEAERLEWDGTLSDGLEAA